jgi:hypothetical protein
MQPVTQKNRWLQLANMSTTLLLLRKTPDRCCLCSFCNEKKLILMKQPLCFFFVSTKCKRTRAASVGIFAPKIKLIKTGIVKCQIIYWIYQFFSKSDRLAFFFTRLYQATPPSDPFSADSNKTECDKEKTSFNSWSHICFLHKFLFPQSFAAFYGCVVCAWWRTINHLIEWNE